MRVAVIRTSDRGNFKRCRRRWGWSSHMRKNLTPKTTVDYFWLGSGVHYAAEDFHGYNIYGHPAKALQAYFDATTIPGSREAPENWRDHTELGLAMMEYYADHWLRNRDPLKTWYRNGKPVVEINFEIPIPFDQTKLEEWGYDKVVFVGTIDRIVIDELERLWVLDYKTAKTIATDHFATDPQISAYIMAAHALFNEPIAGMIYQQHLKAVPEEPKILASGRVSLNKQQRTTHSLYRETLKALYGDVQRAPGDNVKFLNTLLEGETENADRFIRRDYIARNEQQSASESVKILLECEDMLNPNLPLYPNPTKDCSWDCQFKSPCVSLDDGSDFEYELDIGFETAQERGSDTWRQHLKQPQQIESLL